MTVFDDLIQSVSVTGQTKHTPFDSLLTLVKDYETEEEEELETPEKALLSIIRPDTQRFTTPIYEYPESPTSDYATKDISFSQPKLTGNTLQGYCATWLDNNNQEYIDECNPNDHVAKGSWQDTIASAYREKEAKGYDYLLPLLFFHIPPKQNGLIGKVTELQETDKGVEFKATIANLPRSKEAYELARLNVLSASYGYSPLEYEYLPHPRKAGKMYRRLNKLSVHEISVIPIHKNAANPYTHVQAKASQFFVPESYHVQTSVNDYDALLKDIGAAKQDASEAYARTLRMRELDRKANELWTRLACQAGAILREWQ